MTMNVEEARAWLAGDRSWCNAIPSQQYGEHIAITAVADASTTHQAYWIVKAHDDAGRLRADRLERMVESLVVGCATNLQGTASRSAIVAEARALLAELDKEQV